MIHLLKDPFSFLTIGAFRRDPPKPINFLWGDKTNGLMQEQSFTMIHGGEKTGKTMLTTNLAIAAARGDPDFLGFQIREGGFRTLIIQNEVHMRGQYERIETMLAASGLTPEQSERILLNTCRNVTLYEKGVFGYFRLRIRRWKPDLIIIDPLARLITADENDNAAVGNALAPLLVIRDNPGAAVLVVHHDSKVSEGTSMRPAHQRSRGANRLTADPDSIISLGKIRGGIRMSCLARYGAQMEPVRIRMNPDTLWFEPYTPEQEYGEAIKEMVVEFGSQVEEDLLLRMIDEKWQLKDSQGRHRTAHTRLKQAVEGGYVTKIQQGTMVFYAVA